MEVYQNTLKATNKLIPYLVSKTQNVAKKENEAHIATTDEEAQSVIIMVDFHRTAQELLKKEIKELEKQLNPFYSWFINHIKIALFFVTIATVLLLQGVSLLVKTIIHQKEAVVG